MDTVKRVLTVVGMVLSVVVLLVSIAGVVVSWTAGGALKNVSTKVLTGVERGLDVTDDALVRVDERLAGARANINTIEEAVTQVGEEIEETNFALLLIEETVGQELSPKIESARDTLSTVRASVIAFNTTLEAANEIPFVSVPTLTDELEAASQRTTEARTAVDELRSAVKVAKSGAVEGAVGAITQRTSRIDSALQEMQGDVADYQANIMRVEDDVASLKSRIRLWIDIATIIVSVGFVWVALSQVAMMGLGWSYLRNGELVLKKKKEPAAVQAPEEISLASPMSSDDEADAESPEDDVDLAEE